MAEYTSGPATISEKLYRWLEWAVQVQASDLHLVAGHPPVLRVNGELCELMEPALDADEAHQLLTSICPPNAVEQLRTDKNADFSFELPLGEGIARFRASLFHADRKLGACLRFIPNSIPTLEWAGFPEPLAKRLTSLRDGLVIVTGATGHGKTTTLAMLVQMLNKAGGYRIITVEEPVEYRFPREPNSVVTQREVGQDVLTFADGLKFGLRQDPDVILVGEIRDQNTAQMALSAAETGHVVFTTLHTRDAKGAISRFADLFPQNGQQIVRSQLALSLRAIVSQRLLPGIERGGKRHLALEVLWNTHPIANAIRTGKIEGIDNYLLTGREEGMVSFNESVRQLLKAGKISRTIAEENVGDVNLLYR
jgi:twitching motility protein PilT